MNMKLIRIYWLAGLLALCCIGGVFAYWTQELLVHNEFQTARYDTKIEEKFIPPDDWKPGQEVNKDVWVSNQGTVPAFIKVNLHQEWIRTRNITDLNGEIIRPEAGENFPLSFKTEKGNEYAALIKWGDVVLLSSGKKSDIDLGLGVVDKIEDASGKWLLMSDIPDKNGDYLLYFIGMVDGGKKSPLIVDSVTMNPSIKPAVLEKTTYYDASSGEWKTVSERNSTSDYECAKYTILVKATTVQATADAVKSVFSTEGDTAGVVEYLASHAVKPADISQKSLQDGKI